MREAGGGVSDDDVQHVASLLLNDIAGTLGLELDDIVEEATARIRLFTFTGDRAQFTQRVVDDVQQSIHDQFIHTSWPVCPYHPNHPLWYSESRWRCDQNGQQVAPLGGLADKSRRPDN